MEEAYQDCFVVYVLDESAAAERPESVEQAVATCASHEEAARVRQEYRDSGRRCIIRCLGETGGGD